MQFCSILTLSLCLTREGVLSRGRAVRAQCLQSVLSGAGADAVIGALSVAEALLPSPCGSVRAFTFRHLAAHGVLLSTAAREVPHFLGGSSAWHECKWRSPGLLVTVTSLVACVANQTRH